MKINKTLLLAFFTVTAFTLVGCKSAPPGGRPVAWNVSITKKTTASIEVDLIGVATKNEEEYWSGIAASDYWAPNSQIRKDQTKLGNMLTKFLQEGQPWTIDQNDPQWNTWLNRGVNELYIIARLPDATGDWKIPLPVGKKVWDTEGRKLNILVVDSGISVQTKTQN